MSASSRSLTLATVLAVSGSLLAAPGCIIVSDDDDGSDSSVIVFNESDFFIDDIGLALAGTGDYGPNEAPSGGLGPGDSIEFFVECEFYDLLLIDEERVECEVLDLDLCGLVDAEVTFTNNDCFVRNATGETLKKGTVKQARPARDATPKLDVKNAPADVL